MNTMKIQENSVEYVKNYIIESNWIKTEEEFHELIAAMIHILKNNISLQPYLIELMIQLDAKSNEIFYLKNMIPFIVKQSLKSFGKNFIGCSLLYNF